MAAFLASMGGLQRGIGEEGRQFDLSRFMAGRPEQNPLLDFMGPALGNAMYDTAVQQGYYQPGLGTQLLGAGAGILGGGGSLNPTKWF